MTVYLLIQSIIPTFFLVAHLFDFFAIFFLLVFFVFFRFFFWAITSSSVCSSYSFFLSNSSLSVFSKSWGTIAFLFFALINFVFLVLLSFVTKLSYFFLRFSCSKYNFWYSFLHISSNSFVSSSFFLFLLSSLTFVLLKF